MANPLHKAAELFSNKPGPDGTVSNRFKFLLALPGMPLTVSNVLIHNAFLKYYTDIIGLDARLVGVIYLVFGIWNAVNDPLMGIFIDRFKYTRERGKYAYIMRVTVPVIIISAFCMLFASPGWQEWLIFAFFIALLFFFDTAQTAFNIAYVSYKLIAAPTREERVDVNVWGMYIGHIGGLLGTIIPTLLLVGDTRVTLTKVLFSSVLIINAVLYWVGLRKLKDHAEMYKNEEGSEAAQLASFFTDSVKDAFTSRSFLTYVLHVFIGQGAKMFYFTPFLYTMDYVIRATGLQATIVDIIPGAVLFLVLPIVGKLTKQLGVKRSILFWSIPAALSFASISLISNFWQAVAAYTFMGVATGYGGIVGATALGAIIDEDEMKTGVRKAGMFTGLNALLTIPVGGIHAALFTFVISAFTFVSGTDVQSDQAILGIRLASGVIPAITVLLGIIPILFFPISKKREEEISEFAKHAHRNGDNEAAMEDPQADESGTRDPDGSVDPSGMPIPEGSTE